ncbi:hypothetical protein [Pacificoceanicola onchidii]|uniref:hypothetical protein n=1 Tax=Pacificoceanicola onchidii TaxID=2562685 RepID=UPI001F1141B7|nr:hypothetical protein [Pacificoceanicola onchidii]
MKSRQPMSALPRSQQAGILCNDETFQKFVGARIGLADGEPAAPGIAADHVRWQCGVHTRGDLDNPDTRAFHNRRSAAELWDELRTEYDAWRGAIPRPEREPS